MGTVKLPAVWYVCADGTRHEMRLLSRAWYPVAAIWLISRLADLPFTAPLGSVIAREDGDLLFYDRGYVAEHHGHVTCDHPSRRRAAS